MASYRIVSCLFMIGMLSTMLWFNLGRANPGTALSISPPSIVDLALGPGSFFQVNVTVQEVQQMWGFQFSLFYDTNVLTATSYGLYAPLQNFLPSEIDDVEGIVAMAGYTYYGDQEGWTVVDPEPICWIEFVVDNTGASNLDLDMPLVLVDVHAEIIPFVCVDGFFSNGGELKFPPTVSFTKSADTAPVGASLSFDPSGSYDPDGTIILYEWDFDSDGNIDYSSTTLEVVFHTYTSPRTYQVTLTATDNDEYTGKATATVLITSEIPSIWSSDDAGNSKNSFDPVETVFVTVPSTGQQVTLYVVAEKTSWNDGDLFTDVYDGAETVLLDSLPGTQTIQVWAPPLVLGNYDIVMDVNNNGVFDNGVDFVDSISVRPSFAVSEMPFGAAFALTGMFAALAVFVRKKRTR